MLSQLGVSLLLIIPAFAAPASPGGCKAPGGPPDVNSLSTLQALKYNYLNAENNGTAAVLVYDRVSYGHAQRQCSAIGERLYPLHDAPGSNQIELKHQLDYLVYNHDLRANDQVWVGKAEAASKDCSTYSHSRKAIVTNVPCHLQLPALCTSSVPPTTDTNGAVVESSKVSVGWDGYTWTGYRDARSFRFLGVPFADPPVDELRFAPPKAYSGPKKLDATSFSASCIQSVAPNKTLGGGKGISEDCLYLNVYTPILPAADAHEKKDFARKPVAVYFYGGAFSQGSASLIQYDGGNFASRSDVVVVTVNYRVGALGWLATGDLTTGSYGTRDQILALQWVNKNIEAFGGDPSRITIFGQSAGGQSVIALLSSSAAKGLFSAAIVQSAPVDLPWFTRRVYADLVAPEIATAVGCTQAQSSKNQTTSDAQSDSEPDVLACLRALPATAFLDNSTELQTGLAAAASNVAASFLNSSTLLASIEPLMPMVDDSASGVIDDQFHILLANNTLPNRVPTLFTTVSDEAGLYVGQFVPQLPPTQKNFNLLLGLAYPAALAEALAADNVFAINASDPDTVRTTAVHALTYSEWTCPQAYLLDLAVAVDSASTSHPSSTKDEDESKLFPHLYTLQIADAHIDASPNSTTPAICSPNDNYNATCHSADVLPIWGTRNARTSVTDGGVDYVGKEVWHSQLLHDTFGAFFHTQDPNPAPEMLAVRGEAYAYSREVFGDLEIKEYGAGVTKMDGDGESQKEVSQVAVLGFEPGWMRDPRVTEQCEAFTRFGYTFERAEYV